MSVRLPNVYYCSCYIVRTMCLTTNAANFMATVMLSSCVYLGLHWASRFSEGVEMLRHHPINKNLHVWVPRNGCCDCDETSLTAKPDLAEFT